MIGCKGLTRPRLTLVIIFLLLGRVLLLLGVARVNLGFGFTTTSLLFRIFLILGLGSPAAGFLPLFLPDLEPAFQDFLV